MSEEILLKDGVRYRLWNPENEPSDFEPMVKYHIKDIFGEDCQYFSKQKLKTLADNRSIPDGFVIDFENQKWYIVELKLLCDDAVNRVSQQIVRYKNAIKDLGTKRNIYKSIRSVKDAPFLDELINDEKPEIVIVINSLDGKLSEQFREQVEGTDRDVKIVVFKTFARVDRDRNFINPKEVHVHLFEPVYEIETTKMEPRKDVTDISSGYGVEYHKDKGSETIRNIFDELRKRILELGRELPQKTYIAYKIGNKNFVEIIVQKNALQIHIDIKRDLLIDPKDITEYCTWGIQPTGKIRFRLQSFDQIDYAMSLIKQAYDYVSKQKS